MVFGERSLESRAELGFVERTFVEPSWFGRLQDALSRRGIVVLEGPSQCGKTTVLEKALAGRRPAVAGHVERDTTPAQIREWLASATCDALVQIEDLHEAAPDVLDHVRSALRNAGSQGTVVLSGVPRPGQALLPHAPTLIERVARFSEFHRETSEIRSFIELLEAETGVLLSKDITNDFIDAARGSLRLARLLFFTAAEDGVTAADAVKNVGDQLKEFEPPVKQLAESDAETRTPGAVLTLLWHMTMDGTGVVSVDATSALYPSLHPAFRWIREGGLRSHLAKNRDLGAYFGADRALVKVDDPRLRFYLSTRGLEEWNGWARCAGAHVVFEPSDGPPRVKHCPSDPDVVYDPQRDPDFMRVCDAMAEYFNDGNGYELLQLAREVGIHGLPRVDTSSVWTLCFQLMVLAHRQGLLRPLLKRAWQRRENREFRTILEALMPGLGQ